MYDNIEKLPLDVNSGTSYPTGNERNYHSAVVVRVGLGRNGATTKRTRQTKEKKKSLLSLDLMVSIFPYLTFDNIRPYVALVVNNYLDQIELFTIRLASMQSCLNTTEYVWGILGRNRQSENIPDLGVDKNITYSLFYCIQ